MAYQEQFDLLEAYFVCNKSYDLALQWYREKYPDRELPSRKVLSRIVNNLLTVGSFKKKTGRPQQQNLDYSDVELNILTYFECYPKASSREAAQEIGINHTSILKVLKKYKYKCYRDGRLVQKLHPGDSERRLQFCENIRTEIALNPNFLDCIVWSDETNFSNNGMYNRHNNHYWSRQNPFRVRETNNQVRFSFNVWCGIKSNMVVLLNIYEGHLNAAKYIEILELLKNQLNLLPEEERNNIIFQQDGAPAHNSRIARAYLNENFNAWIGTNGTIRWPARSPDLTPMDFFLWGHVKNVVYETCYETVQELRIAVENVIRGIHHNTLLKATRNEFQRRLMLCSRNDGAHFEQFIS